MAADAETRVVIWFRNILNSLDEMKVEATVIYKENYAFLVIAKREGIFLTSKNIVLRYHYLLERFEQNMLQMIYVSTNEQLAD